MTFLNNSDEDGAFRLPNIQRLVYHVSRIFSSTARTAVVRLPKMDDSLHHRASVITVLNLKGGVGKTHTC